MSKQIKNVYETLCTYENLYQAYLNARKNKRYRDEVLDFSFNLEEKLMEISYELKTHTYKIGGYREFFVYIPKKRLIMALPFKDRVVQWAIYQLVNPHLDNSYIDDSYGCRVGKGTHKGVQRLHYWLKQVNKKPNKYYYLKLDITKYYYRIDHEILISIFEKKIKDKELLDLLKVIITYDGSIFGLKLDGKVDNPEDRIPSKGMPIGNLTSQMFANLYLNELDQYCKRQLGIKYYVRYMDDIIILSDDKAKLHEYKDLIQTFIESKLNLHLNNKTTIRPIALGIEFIGYRLWPTHIKVRKSTSLRMKRRIKYVVKQFNKNQLPFEKVNATVQSYMGILKHCNSYNLQNKIFQEVTLKKESNNNLANQDLP
ncbi:reverse transcriptase domain-containing protein [Clostridium lundense]|uniref:reverse transcriptase domain-containing protein n=1 Tax=Clostridium lundense TaxID=319475 RepID=UPI0005582B57|nr:reverse transcriptase domain-containing protein [Clostridium lundense]